jgi:hypothetical protein
MGLMARIEDGVIREIREIDPQVIPAHKRTSWLPVTREGAGSQVKHIIESDKVRAVNYPTIDDVRLEAQRRIIALVGATDLMSCLVKQLNANMRANELNDIQQAREFTQQESAEATYLRSLATQIKSIRAASNVLEPNPPSDFNDNKYWP